MSRYTFQWSYIYCTTIDAYFTLSMNTITVLRWNLHILKTQMLVLKIQISIILCVYTFQSHGISEIIWINFDYKDLFEIFKRFSEN